MQVYVELTDRSNKEMRLGNLVLIIVEPDRLINKGPMDVLVIDKFWGDAVVTVHYYYSWVTGIAISPAT